MFVAAHSAAAGQPFSSSTPPSTATTPTQMRHFYGVDGVNFGGVTGDGSGQTIAIVDVYDDPKALSDLQHFDSFYGLSDPPSFLQYNENGQLLPESGGTGTTPGQGKHGNGWQIEESLDIEWAHVIAPAAKIALIECNSSSFTDLFAGVSAAGGIPNVVCVSMSWGSNGEFLGENSFDSTFSASGVTYLGATGDSGESATSYPAASPDVVAVGGTTIHFASGTTDGTYGRETVWSGTGGELSPYESKPSYQNAVLSGTERGTPDVSMDADPNTGVAIYDSYDFGTSAPWAQYGGTSLSTPMWAALIAIADQGRAGASLTPLSGSSQTLPKLYSAAATNFHDVTSGSNGSGNNATVGYDTVTGIGTPVADVLLNTLAGVPAAVRQLAFTQPPASTVAGVPIDSPTGVQVAVQNQSGTTITSDSSTVTLQLNGGTFAGGGNTTMGTAVHGVATFTGLVIDATGSYTLTATDGVMMPLTSASFAVTPAASSTLVFGVQPNNSTAGVAISPAVTVDVKDAFGNLATTDGSTVTLTLTGGAFSTGSATATAGVSGGIATFSGLVINTAATYTATASDGSMMPVTSVLFGVGPGAPSILAFAVGPGAVVAGNPLSPAIVVDVEDSFGNLITTDGSTVTLRLNAGVFSTGAATATAVASGGIATFGGLVINNAGSYTLAATDGSLTPAMSGSFNVSMVDVINTIATRPVTLTRDPDGQHIDWSNGTSIGAIPINDPNGLTLNGDSGYDHIALSYANGGPLPNVLHLNGTYFVDNIQGANPLAGTTLDVNRSTVYISYGSSDPFVAILGYIRNGYNNGAWNGTPTSTTGVITSSAALNSTNHNTAVGYADWADGRAVDAQPNTIELKYTLYGDANLDGAANSEDVQRLLTAFNSSGVWDQGDFNYDGIVDSGDLQAILAAYNTSLGSQAVPATASLSNGGSTLATGSDAQSTVPLMQAPVKRLARPPGGLAKLVRHW
jgi:hypothetical protein